VRHIASYLASCYHLVFGTRDRALFALSTTPSTPRGDNVGTTARRFNVSRERAFLVTCSSARCLPRGRSGRNVAHKRAHYCHSLFGGWLALVARAIATQGTTSLSPRLPTSCSSTPGSGTRRPTLPYLCFCHISAIIVGSGTNGGDYDRISSSELSVSVLTPQCRQDAHREGPRRQNLELDASSVPVFPVIYRE